MLNNLFAGLETRKKKKVRGRGIGCTKGKTSGRGHKGQKSRSGVSIKGFEGGQQSILTRLPKRGFNSLCAKKYSVITLSIIEKLLAAGKISTNSIVTKEDFLRLGIISSVEEKIKVIGKCNNVEGKLLLAYDFISSGAKEYVISSQ